MEGPHIKFDTEHEYSKSPEDNGFSNALQKLKESGSPLATALEEISRSPKKTKIIGDALNLVGYGWNRLISLEEPQDKDALQSFGHLIAFWDEPINGVPKTDQDHQAEAEAFAKLLG